MFLATGEPPLCMSCCIPLAIRNALDSARADAGNSDPWYRLGMYTSTRNRTTNNATASVGTKKTVKLNKYFFFQMVRLRPRKFC